MGWNQLSGEIPESIGSLTSLIGLNLSVNQLTGGIIDFEPLINLKYLYLTQNPELGGVIPATVINRLTGYSIANTKISIE